MTRIPNYIADLLERSEFNTDHPKAIGYSIRVWKRSHYSMIDTLKEELERMERWVKRQMPLGYDWEEAPVMTIDYIPSKTTHDQQYACVTIFDPIMQSLERHIRVKD